MACVVLLRNNPTMKIFWMKLVNWETWHHHAKYIPLIPAWLWHCIKARSFWFFSASNPTLTFGGFEGEGKEEMYSQLPQDSYPKMVVIQPGTSNADLLAIKERNGFNYPFAVKPDVGMMGFMFRRITNEEQLFLYHKSMPVTYLMQTMIDLPLEVSVFYYRMPGQPKGKVTGFSAKHAPFVIGDGVSNLETLIANYKDLKYLQAEMKERHREKIDLTLAKNESFVLSFASNRSQGGKIVTLSHEIDERLNARFDEISNHTKHFYYGRFDVKCLSVEDLKAGKNFAILEFNGAGAGIQHIYGNGLSLIEACKTILIHWRMMYEISTYNNRVNGVKFWEFFTGLKFLKAAKQNLEMLKKLDAEFPTL